jgi:hypothetical protein
MKRLVLIAATAGIFVAGLTVSSLATASSPPGQDPCSHGNSNKPCKTDPSTNGKDCDPHGNGGINEDHCLGTTATTGTTPATTTAATPKVGEPAPKRAVLGAKKSKTPKTLPAASSETLPFTGISLRFAALLVVLLILGGLGLRASTGRRG